MFLVYSGDGSIYIYTEKIREWWNTELPKCQMAEVLSQTERDIKAGKSTK